MRHLGDSLSRRLERNIGWYLPGGAAAFVGPLDGLSNIIAAYSTRRLLSSYTGALIRLRRSSDNAESDFTYDGAGDLDVATIAAWLGAATGYIKTWYDQSGNSYHVTQATAANQPTYVAIGQNNKPVLDFAGGLPAVASYLTCASITSDAMPNSAFIAHKADIGGANSYAYLSTTSDTHAIWNGSLTYQMVGGAIANPNPLVVPSGNAELLTCIWSTTGTQFWINTSQKVIGNVGAANLDSIRLGRQVNNFLNGWLYEVIVFNNDASAVGATVRGIVNSYWSIY